MGVFWGLRTHVQPPCPREMRVILWMPHPAIATTYTEGVRRDRYKTLFPRKSFVCSDNLTKCSLSLIGYHRI